MDEVNRKIWSTFRIKRNDTLPMVGWAGTRITLAKMLGELKFNRGAEVGVQRGEYSVVLCDANPALHLLCIDPWHPYSYPPVSEEKAETHYEQAKSALSGRNATLIRAKSMEAVQRVEDGSLDFVYIDGLHTFDSVMLDLIHWSQKVRQGGVVAGHDFCNFYKAGIVDAVYAYTRAHNIHLWYLTRDHPSPSFFWVHLDASPCYW